MDLGLNGKKALVMGGTEGLGFAIAQILLQEGAEVCLASRTENKIERALKELSSSKASGLGADLTDLSSLERLAQIVLQRGGVDILVLSGGGPAAGPVLSVTLEQWDLGYQLLLKSVFFLTQSFIPTMREKKWGRILNITSTAAVEVIPNLPVSATFRAGLSAWTKAMAKEIGRDNILINNLLPGTTRTSRLKELATSNPHFLTNAASQSALGRIAEPDEIGRVGAFLCSNANTYITGTNIIVDGGATVRCS